MRTIDFATETISYKRQANLIKVTRSDRKSGAVLDELLVEPAVAAKHFADKLDSWKAMPRSKK